MSLCAQGKRSPLSANQRLAGPVEPQPAAVKYQEAVEPARVESPVPYRPSVDVNKAGMRVPADATALHRPGFGHCIGKLRFEANVERAALDMLAALGNAKGRPSEHRIRLGGTIGRKDRCLGLTDRIEHIGQEVDHPDIDLGLLPGLMVAEKNAELVDDRFDRAFIVAVRPVENLARMRVGEPQPPQRDGRAGNCMRDRRSCGASSYKG
jgi:hypothetical protein